MYIHTGYIIAMVLGFLAGYLLYLFSHHLKISEERKILYFFLPVLPLGVLIGLFEAFEIHFWAMFFGLMPLVYSFGFLTCLIVQTSKEAEGGNIDGVKRRLNTVFVKASTDGNLPAVQALLDAGADVNSKSTHFGEMALIMAAEKGHVEIVKLLLENGAAVNAKDEYGRTALMETVGGACSEIFFDELKLLREEDGASSSHVPLRAVEIIKFLLEKNADINTKDKDGVTALWLAANGGSLEIVNILLEKGADVNAKDTDGRTALGAAKRSGHEDIAQLLKKASTKAK